MIIDAILGVLLAVPNMLLDGMGNIGITIPDGVFSFLSSVLPFLGYLLPIVALLPLMGIEMAVMIFKIVWAIILRVKSFVPTMGA